MVTTQEFLTSLTKVVEDYLDAGNYTNFKELMKEVKEEATEVKKQSKELLDNGVLSYDDYFLLYRMWCYVEDGFAPNYKFDDEYEMDCQFVRKFYDKVVTNINKN